MNAPENDRLPLNRDDMKFLTIFALAAAASSEFNEFTCIKPINPIPAGLPGVCCTGLIQGSLLKFVYTGKNCMLFEG